MKAILYVGHGTRSKSGAEEAREFIQGVMRRIDCPIQEYGFLELAEPSIERAFEHCVNRGAKSVDVVPLFLLAAGHIKKDIPRILSSMNAKFPFIQVRLRDPFGVQDQMLEALPDLVRDIAGRVLPPDRILIVGRGSSDPGIHLDFTAIVNGLKERLAIEDVSACYLAAAKPSLQDELQTMAEHADRRTVIIPYLLFSGVLLAEIDRQVRTLRSGGYEIMHTGPLCRHRMIEDMVIKRVTGEYRKVRGENEHC